ncbi:unnamed protein product [Cochlearia groenlandica]
MFFAQEDIAPLEVTYDYNYVIDQVHDAEGNIKKKCHCGSLECIGMTSYPPRRFDEGLSPIQVKSRGHCCYLNRIQDAKTFIGPNVWDAMIESCLEVFLKLNDMEKFICRQKNGSYTDPTGRRKSKRFKFTEPLSDSQSRTEHRDVSFEFCKNKNDVSGDCVDGKVCNDMHEEAESHVDEKDTSEVVVSACGQSVVRTNNFRKRAVSVVKNSSPNKSIKLSKNQKTVKVTMSSPSKPINDKKSLARNPRLSPSHSTSSSNNEDSARRKVREALSLFRETCRKIVDDE